MRLRSIICVLAAVGLSAALFQQPALAFPGERLWQAHYTGGAHSQDLPQALAASPDGSTVFITGIQVGLFGQKTCLLTVAYDAATGGQLWLACSALIYGEADAIAVSPDGSSVFVTGEEFREGRQYYITIAYDASSGQQEWLRRDGDPSGGWDFARAIRVSPDGTAVYVTGESPQDLPGGSATIAYDAATGDRLWVVRYAGSHDAGYVAYGMGIAPDGSMVYITGVAMAANSGTDYLTLALDAASGRRVWVRRYNGRANSDDNAYGLAVSPDGSTVVVTGTSSPQNFESGFVTVAYDAATGVRKWIGRYHDHNQDNVWAIAMNPTGSMVYVMGQGHSAQFATQDVTIGYDVATGATVWTRHYGRSGAGPGAIGVSPDGSKVFVTGWVSHPANSADYGTIAYDAATGESLWSRSFHGEFRGVSDDEATALGVSPDGSKVFVTGTSSRKYSNAVAVTLAYSTT